MKFKESLKKLNLSFFNKIQGKLFKDLAADCATVSAVFAGAAMVATVAALVVTIILMLCGVDGNSVANIVFGAGFALAFIGAGCMTYKPILAIPTIGLKIAFIAYLVVLFLAIASLTAIVVNLLINLLFMLLVVIILIPVANWLWNEQFGQKIYVGEDRFGNKAKYRETMEGYEKID